jgi:hypothetical protein
MVTKVKGVVISPAANCFISGHQRGQIARLTGRAATPDFRHSEVVLSYLANERGLEKKQVLRVAWTDGVRAGAEGKSLPELHVLGKHYG